MCLIIIVFSWETDFARFQTRMQYVQNAEQELAEKKKHCKTPASAFPNSYPDSPDANVVKAFESALALLNK